LDIPTDTLGGDDTIQTSIEFNQSTNITTFKWIDTNTPKQISSGRLAIWKQINIRDNELICNNSASFSSGSVICDTSDYNGTFVAKGYTTSSDGEETLREILQFSIKIARALFGNTGLIIGWFIVLTATLVFIWNPTLMFTAHTISIIFVSLIGFVQFSTLYIFGSIIITILAWWLIKV
jgi:hypothetical protein